MIKKTINVKIYNVLNDRPVDMMVKVGSQFVS